MHEKHRRENESKPVLLRVNILCFPLHLEFDIKNHPLVVHYTNHSSFSLPFYSVTQKRCTFLMAVSRESSAQLKFISSNEKGEGSFALKDAALAYSCGIMSLIAQYLCNLPYSIILNTHYLEHLSK